MQTTTFDLEPTPLFALVAGHGVPVIFMHGITGNAYVFEPMIRALASHCQTISIDQRGHGRSGRPATYQGIDYAADIAALIDRLDMGPAILVGHSLGARNAYVAANAYPDRVLGVIGVDFTPFIEIEVLEQLEARVSGGDRAFESLDAVKTYLANRYPLLPPDAIDRRAHHGYQQTADGLRPLADGHAMRLTAAGLKSDITDEIRRLTTPTVLVRGRQSKLVSEAAWQRTQQLRPDLPAVEIDHCDHYVPEVQPAALTEVVRDAIDTFNRGR